MKFSKKEILVVVGIAILFLAFRLPAIHSPYHQDEYKWVTYVNPALNAPGGIPHPPIGELIYSTAGKVIGYDNFRYVPLLFSLVNLFLLFYLVKNIAGGKAAFWSAFLFAVSAYSVIASLMVDTDGAILPFFFLLSAISYYKLRESNFKIDKTKWKWLIFLFVAVICGFLVKVSFLIGVGALVLDFVFEKHIFTDRKKVLKYLGIGLVLVAGFALVLIASKFVFPYFRLGSSVKYWEHFLNSSSFLGRGWMQIFIQFAKSVLYTSPFLLLPMFFADKEIWLKTRPFFLFVFIGLFFYLVAFDFSIGALDRYFQFLIVPLCVIGSVIIAKIFGNKEMKLRGADFVLVFVIAALVFSLQFFGHFVPPLHPKAEWISRIVSLKWNFLYPFSGGSGPLGFYVSFMFMAVAWILSAVSGVLWFLRPRLRKASVLVIIFIGLIYNGVFVEEYLFGKINGSAPGLVRNVTKFIKNNPAIKKVTVYNDNGGYEIQQMGKYRKRLYVDPSFDLNVKMDTLNKYKENYLEINIPRIDPGSIYRKYLDSCKIIYNQTDKSISATVYDCKDAPDITGK